MSLLFNPVRKYIQTSLLHLDPQRVQNSRKVFNKGIKPLLNQELVNSIDKRDKFVYYFRSTIASSLSGYDDELFLFYF